MIREIKSCSKCPLYKYIDEGMGGKYDACLAEEPLYGRAIRTSIWSTRPEWCPFKVGDKIEFVFVETKVEGKPDYALTTRTWKCENGGVTGDDYFYDVEKGDRG